MSRYSGFELQSDWFKKKNDTFALIGQVTLNIFHEASNERSWEREDLGSQKYVAVDKCCPGSVSQQSPSHACRLFLFRIQPKRVPFQSIGSTSLPSVAHLGLCDAELSVTVLNYLLHVFLVSLVPCTISGVLAAANPSHWQLQHLQFADNRSVCVIIGRQVYSLSHPMFPLQKMRAFQLFKGGKSA